MIETFEVATPRIDPPFVAVRVPAETSEAEQLRIHANFTGHTGGAAVVVACSRGVHDYATFGPTQESLIVRDEARFLNFATMEFSF